MLTLEWENLLRSKNLTALWHVKAFLLSLWAKSRRSQAAHLDATIEAISWLERCFQISEMRRTKNPINHRSKKHVRRQSPEIRKKQFIQGKLNNILFWNSFIIFIHSRKWMKSNNNSLNSSGITEWKLITPSNSWLTMTLSSPGFANKLSITLQ